MVALLHLALVSNGQGQDEVDISPGSPDCEWPFAEVDPGPGVILHVGNGTRVWVNAQETLVLDGTLVVYGLPYASQITVTYRRSFDPNWLPPQQCQFNTISATAPVNDEDCTAEQLTIASDCVPVTGTLIGASNHDVWYTFQAGPGPYSSITVTPTGTEMLRATLHQGFCDGGLTSMSAARSFAPGEPARLNVGGLIEGYTYYVQVDSASIDSRSADFSICIAEAGQPIDCLGVVGGTALTGTACDDGNVCTIDDLWGSGCLCSGTRADADADGTCDAYDRCPGNPEPGTPCDDDNDCTYADMWGWNCSCAGVVLDSDDDGTPNCEDECPGDANKILRGACGCFRADEDSDNDGIIDCLDRCVGLYGTRGSPCDDGDANTQGDIINTDCECAGGNPPSMGYDCMGDPGGAALPGTTCYNVINGVPFTSTWTANCTCVVPTGPDTDGDGIEDDVDPCDEVPSSQNPPYCPDRCFLENGGSGRLIGCDCVSTDCNQPAPPVNHDLDADSILTGVGFPGSFDNAVTCYGLLGSPCQDGDPNTINDRIMILPGQNNCACIGAPQPADCSGVPGGFDFPGMPCDDLQACTVNDIWTESCTCSGTFSGDTDSDGTCDAQDPCPTIANAQDGSSCDDGNGCTIDDMIHQFSNGCFCYGTDTYDVDEDGTCGGLDNCPDISNTDQVDADDDNIGDACDTCPDVAGQIGSPCDDGNENTVDDSLGANCVCAGSINVAVLAHGQVSLDLTLYPNPAMNGSVTISSTKPLNDLRIELMDVFGRTVLDRTGVNIRSNMQLDLSALAAGQYMVRFTADEGNATRRLILQH